MAPCGKSARESNLLETKASVGFSRGQITLRPRPFGNSIGTSFKECTAISALFSSMAISSSLTNKPLPPTYRANAAIVTDHFVSGSLHISREHASGVKTDIIPRKFRPERSV